MSERKAWELAYMVFGAYEYNDYLSRRAGYRIYVSRDENNNGWISDLETRLEINLENGKSINIYIA